MPRLAGSVAIVILAASAVAGCAATPAAPAQIHTSIAADPQYAAAIAVAKELHTSSLGTATWASEWMDATDSGRPKLELLIAGDDAAREISVRLIGAGFRAAGGSGGAARWLREGVTGTQMISVLPLQLGDKIERHAPRTGAAEHATIGKVGIQILIGATSID